MNDLRESPAVQELIHTLGLTRLGFEGGYFKEQVRSSVSLPPGSLGEGPAGPRSLHTAIFYLLTPHTRSLMHRLQSDEVYHFYRGDPVELLLLHPDCRWERRVLGSRFEAGEEPQAWVPAGVWQGSRVIPGGEYAFMGTTMSPGFDLRDFELGDRESLQELYGGVGPLLESLTPERIRSKNLEASAATAELLDAEAQGVERLAKGLGAEPPSTWPPPYAPDLEAPGLALGPEGCWGRWYLVRREDRRLVGVAGYEGAPRDGQVALRPVTWTAEVPSHLRAPWGEEAQSLLRAHARSRAFGVQ